MTQPAVHVPDSLRAEVKSLAVHRLRRAHRDPDWDPYPFILLNLVLSFQATYAGPIVLLAGNRQSQKDRITLEHAADESDKGEQHITKILIEIKKNTALTLQILRELEAEGA